MPIIFSEAKQHRNERKREEKKTQLRNECNELLARVSVLEKRFAMKISLVDIEGVSERVCKSRNLNQHFRFLL